MLKIIVATSQRQGEREGDFCHTREGEIVIASDDCDCLHSGCDCTRSMVGAETGKGTTTMMVVESTMTRAEYVEAVRLGETSGGFDDLLAPGVFEAEADALLRLAGEFPAGAVIERNGEDYTIRA